jgi:hypothetical protein
VCPVLVETGPTIRARDVDPDERIKSPCREVEIVVIDSVDALPGRADSEVFAEHAGLTLV